MYAHLHSSTEREKKTATATLVPIIKRSRKSSQCSDTFMWLLKPINSSSHTGACACTLKHALKVCVHARTHSNIHSLQLFQGLIKSFHLRKTLNTTIKSIVHAKKSSKRLFLVSEDSVLIHRTPLDSCCQSPKQRHHMYALYQRRNAASGLRGPSMFFPEPHRGFSENTQTKTHALTSY